jgi:hypothetical protein
MAGPASGPAILKGKFNRGREAQKKDLHPLPHPISIFVLYSKQLLISSQPQTLATWIAGLQRCPRSALNANNLSDSKSPLLFSSLHLLQAFRTVWLKQPAAGNFRTKPELIFTKCFFNSGSLTCNWDPANHRTSNICLLAFFYPPISLQYDGLTRWLSAPQCGQSNQLKK